LDRLIGILAHSDDRAIVRPTEICIVTLAKSSIVPAQEDDPRKVAHS
jgi:hypothetical protein